MPELQTYQMRGVVPNKARYVKLVETGITHDGMPVLEPQDVTLYVESLKSAWEKHQANHSAEIERLRKRVEDLEAQLKAQS